MSDLRDLFTSSINSTTVSMNERFTFLQKNARPMQTTLLRIRTNNAANHQATAKNRRLAMQMERRLTAMAALKIKKKSIRQRLGVPSAGGQGNNMRDMRLTGPNRGRGGRYWNNRGGGRPRSRSRSRLPRSQSVQSLTGGNMQRSRSMQSLNNDLAVPHRSRSRSRSRSMARARSRSRNRAPSIGRKEPAARNRRAGSIFKQERLQKANARYLKQQMFPNPWNKRSNPGYFWNKRTRNIGLQTDQKNFPPKRGRGGGSGNFQNRGRGLPRGRGGRGQRGGRGGLTRTVRANMKNLSVSVPTKEELDQELDQYMANTKTQLDKDLDTYMKEQEEVNVTA